VKGVNGRVSYCWQREKIEWSDVGGKMEMDREPHVAQIMCFRKL